MAVLQMQRISICALKKDRKAILEKIQSMGIMEMSQVAEDEDGFEKMDTISARQSFEKKASLSESALDILDAYAPEKKSMFASLEGKKLVESDQFAKITAKKKKFWKKPKGLLPAIKKLPSIRPRVQSWKIRSKLLCRGFPWMCR